MAAPFAFDRSWEFDVGCDELWRVLCRTDEFPSWWSWLDEFSAGGLQPGASARFTVRSPLPYSLRFDVDVEEVVPERLVAATVGGDLVGPARLELAPRRGGDEGGAHRPVCTARLVWSLELRRPLLRQVGVLARPVMSWGHDRVVEQGVRQFVERALGERR